MQCIDTIPYGNIYSSGITSVPVLSVHCSVSLFQVNSVSWNDTGTRLISGSDDCHLNRRREEAGGRDGGRRQRWREEAGGRDRGRREKWKKERWRREGGRGRKEHEDISQEAEGIIISPTHS